MERSPHFFTGIELFNQREYWHAHEAWEDAWKSETDDQVRLFYKGIIQTAAALVHWQRGNNRGLFLNWRKARAKLTQLPAHFYDLDIRVLLQVMDVFEAAQGVGLQPPMLTLDAPNQ